MRSTLTKAAEKPERALKSILHFYPREDPDTSLGFFTAETGRQSHRAAGWKWEWEVRMR